MVVLVTTILVAIPISILIAILTYNLYYRLRFKLPPGPRPLPVVGNLYDIKPVRFRCFSDWASSYGPIISVWFGSTLNVIVSSSKLAKQVLKENDQQLADRHRSRSAAKFSRDGQDLIWADYGPHYVKVRKVCTLELFTPKRLESLRPIREDEVTAMVEAIFRDGGGFDIVHAGIGLEWGSLGTRVCCGMQETIRICNITEYMAGGPLESIFISKSRIGFDAMVEALLHFLMLLALLFVQMNELRV